MAVIGILLIALGCLIAGLITQSSAWLVASLVATSAAGYLLYRRRHVIATPKRVPPTDLLPEGLAKAAVSRGASDPKAETEADDPANTQDDEPPLEDDDKVWVIDGRPRYHLGECAMIKGQDAEPISYEQASEDGFMPCSLCEPQSLPIRRGVPPSPSKGSG